MNFRTVIAMVLAVFIAGPIDIKTAFALDCFPDEIILNSQAAVDNFPGNHGLGCDTLTGLLYINGADITNLNGLADLKYSQMSIVIEANPMLVDLSGLASLESVAFDFFLVDNPLIENLDDLAALKTVSSGVFEVRDCPLLNDVSGLINLTLAHNFVIARNAALINLVWPPLLEQFDEIAIFDNANLVSITGMTGFSNTPTVVVESNPKLQNLDGFSTLVNQSLNYLSIQNNPQLSSLEGMSGITLLRELAIVNNDLLSDLTGLEGIQSITNNLKISKNDALTGIAGLANLTSIGGNLVISENPVLPDLDGLEQISDLGDPLYISCLLFGGCLNLQISQNAELVDISGLNQLIEVAEFMEVIDNPMLDDCSPLKKLLDPIDDGDPGPGPLGIPDVGRGVSMSGNLPGCNILISANGFESD